MRPAKRLSLATAAAGLLGAICLGGIASGAGAPTATVAAAAAQPAEPVEGQPVEGRDFAAGEVVVRFRGEAAERVHELPERIEVADAVDALEENPRVRWAVPDYIATAAGPGWVPNDSGVKGGPDGGWQDLQWHFLPCGSGCDDEPSAERESFGGIDAPGAWRNLIQAGRPGARGVRVAVVDTGVAYRNRGRKFRRSPDLKGIKVAAPRDFVDRDRRPLDENGHGTHVASTIVERTDNRKFVTGIAYRAKLIPVRVLDRRGSGRSSAVSKGIRWAARKRAKAINLSLEFPRGVVNGCRQIPNVCAAISKARASGALVVSVTGNTGAPAVAYPGRAPNALAVGATTERGCLARYSGHGQGVDVVAPGGGRDHPSGGPQCRRGADGPGIVQLTLAKQKPQRFRKFGYPDYEGTSMASAHVTGTAALVWAVLHARLGRAPTPDEVVQRLTETARTEGGLRDPLLYGAGLIDAAAATQ